MNKDIRNAYLRDIYDFQYGKGNTIEDIGGDFLIYGSNGAVGYTDKYNSEDAPVIGHIGAYAGIVNWATGKHFVTYNGVICKIKNGINPRFGYYSLLVSKLQSRLRGSTQPFVSYDLLNDVKVYLPEINRQNCIAKVLSDLDAKIELNNKINAELEAMAKFIYDYWFVQFDFPDENGTPYKSSGGKMIYNEELKREIPERWEVKKLIDLCNKIGDGIHGTPNYVEESEYKFINGNNLKNGFIQTDTDTKNVSQEEYEKYFIQLDEGTILLSINGTLGNLAVYAGEKVMLGKSSAYINCKSNYRSYCYQFLKQPHMPKLFWNVATGSTIKNLSLDSIKKFKILVPNDELVGEFHKRIGAMDNKRKNIFKENQKLTELRDWLLPMLMNGQVRVN